MKVETNNLKTYSNYAKLKNLSRQRIYKLVEAGKLNEVTIDGVKFILMDLKAKKYVKQFP